MLNWDILQPEFYFLFVLNAIIHRTDKKTAKFSRKLSFWAAWGVFYSVVKWHYRTIVQLIMKVGLPQKQDYPRLNVAPDLNNLLWFSDLSWSMIVKKNSLWYSLRSCQVHPTFYCHPNISDTSFTACVILYTPKSFRHICRGRNKFVQSLFMI